MYRKNILDIRFGTICSFKAFTGGFKRHPSLIRGDYYSGYQGLGVRGKWSYFFMYLEFRMMIKIY